MEAGVHIAVRWLEGTQPHLTRTAQDRAVGARVQLDLVAAGRRPLFGQRSNQFHLILGSTRRSHAEILRPTIGRWGAADQRTNARGFQLPVAWDPSLRG
jgi:hypothetical protein